MRTAIAGSLCLWALFSPLAVEAATVLSVGDGDTLRVVEGEQRTTIRVACIDAPETAQTPYGLQAREALLRLTPVGSSVMVRAKEKDRFGRTVAEVFTNDGRNAGLELVQQGHAFVYRQYLEGCDAAAYLNREKQAERSRIGVWEPPGGIQRPWDWRAARRGGTKSTGTPQQRPASLTIINPDSGSGVPSGSGRRWRCAEVGSWQRAQQLLREGHTYLDGDGDGEACERLR